MMKKILSIAIMLTFICLCTVRTVANDKSEIDADIKLCAGVATVLENTDIQYTWYDTPKMMHPTAYITSRTGPGFKYTCSRILTLGMDMPVLGEVSVPKNSWFETGRWSIVKFDGDICYVHSEYMSDEPIIDVSDAEYEELAKIIMCEASGEDFDGKVLIGNVVMNRVNSDRFPDDIISVINQESNGVYQFSPVGSGNWDSVVPSEECYKAVDAVLNGYTISYKALYFESCDGESWHSRNLELLFEHGGHRFYK